MTNEQLFDDLKQFIAATVSQQTTDLRSDINEVKHDITEVKQDVKRLDRKIDQVQEDIGDTLQKVLDGLDATKQIQELDKRVWYLEHKTA